MAALRLASIMNNLRNSDDNSTASLVYLRPGKWRWRHSLVRAAEIEIVVEEDVVIPRSFRWLAVVVAVPVELMVMDCEYDWRRRAAAACFPPDKGRVLVFPPPSSRQQIIPSRQIGSRPIVNNRVQQMDSSRCPIDYHD